MHVDSGSAVYGNSYTSKKKVSLSSKIREYRKLMMIDEDRTSGKMMIERMFREEIG